MRAIAGNWSTTPVAIKTLRASSERSSSSTTRNVFFESRATSVTSLFNNSRFHNAAVADAPLAETPRAQCRRASRIHAAPSRPDCAACRHRKQALGGSNGRAPTRPTTPPGPPPMMIVSQGSAAQVSTPVKHSISAGHSACISCRVVPKHLPREGLNMNFIIWIVIGGLIGWVASMIMKTDAQQGIFLNIVVGIVGALAGRMADQPAGGRSHDQSRRIQYRLVSCFFDRRNHFAGDRQSVPSRQRALITFNLRENKMNRDTTKGLDPTPDANRDPLTGAPGSHPVGTASAQRRAALQRAQRRARWPRVRSAQWSAQRSAQSPVAWPEKQLPRASIRQWSIRTGAAATTASRTTRAA